MILSPHFRRLPKAKLDDVNERSPRPGEVIALLTAAARRDAKSKALLVEALIEARAALGITDDFIPKHVSFEVAGKIEQALASLKDDPDA